MGLEIDVKKQMCFGRNWILSQSSLRPFPTEVRACKENPSNIWLCATIFNNEFVNILWFKNTIINCVPKFDEFGSNYYPNYLINENYIWVVSVNIEEKRFYNIFLQ